MNNKGISQLPKFIKLIPLALVLVLFVTTSCNKPKDCENGVKGIILDETGIGGCEWIIKLNSGESLEPKNIEDFNFTPVDGMMIWVSYEIVTTGGTNCMMGDVVTVECISER